MHPLRKRTQYFKFSKCWTLNAALDKRGPMHFTALISSPAPTPPAGYPARAHVISALREHNKMLLDLHFTDSILTSRVADV